MKNRFYKIILILIVFAAAVNGQRMLKMTVDNNGEINYVPYLVRNQLTYVSGKDLSKALNGNYYLSESTQKIELKFPDFNLKFTARNHFVVLIAKADNSQQVFQMPVMPIYYDKDVFIPAVYSIEYLSKAYSNQLIFDDGRKNITTTNRPSDTKIVTQEIPDTDIEIKVPDVTTPASLSDYDISNLVIEEKSNGTLIKLNAGRKINKFSSNINQGKLYLFFSGVSVDPEILKNVTTSGLVQKIEKKSISGNVQLEFLLKEGYSTSEAFQDPNTNEIFVTVHNKLLAGNTKDLELEKDKWQFDVVVIDPGHGGKDGGAVGVTGVLEKDINLAVGLKLGKMIEEKLPNVKVVYTRKTDKFVELFKRGKIANENNGKLFISIHCNSLKKKPSNTRGFEVYLLRPGRTKEAIAIAEFENSVIQYEDDPDKYKELTDENFILVSMAHSAYMRYSEKFSQILNERWEKDVRIPSRGIKQAGFYVLVGASMPGVLVESGFLSNRIDEAYLNSSAGQMAIAKAIYNSVLNYKDYYDQFLVEKAN